MATSCTSRGGNVSEVSLSTCTFAQRAATPQSSKPIVSTTDFGQCTGSLSLLLQADSISLPGLHGRRPETSALLSFLGEQGQSKSRLDSERWVTCRSMT